MKINKKLQYGILFTMYVKRAGRARVSDAAINMRLAPPFLEQVANILKRGGILKSVRGPGGGYEMNGDPKMREIFDLFETDFFMDQSEYEALAFNELEGRALASLVASFRRATHPFLQFRVSEVLDQTVNLEVSAMDLAQHTTGVQ